MHDRTERVKAFIRGYAEQHGMHSPDGRGSRREMPVVKLPIENNKTRIWQLYRNAVSFEQTPVSFNYFCEVWKMHFPHCKIMTKRTDFCKLCVFYRTLAKDSGPEYKIHIEHARQERVHLKQTIGNTVEKRLANNMSHIHLSFDFAEAIRLPVFIDQPGDSYFTSGFKCGLFGICNNTVGMMDTYILPEGKTPNVNANTTISLLHHYLERHNVRSLETLDLMADNCTGQNKNAAVMQYLLWRVASGLGPRQINLHFLVPGHTKMRNDAYFGLIKRNLKKRQAFSYEQMCEVVNDATSSSTRGVLVDDDFEWYDWWGFLRQYFNKGNVNNLMQNRRFCFSADNPGTVIYKMTSAEESWREGRLLLPNLSPDSLMNNINMKPLSDFIFPPKQMGPRRRKELQTTVIDRYYIGPELERIAAQMGFQSGKTHTHNELL